MARPMTAVLPLTDRRTVAWQRAVVVGLALVPLNVYWVTMMELVRYAGHPSNIAPFANVVFIVVVLLCLNPLLARVTQWVSVSWLRPFTSTELMLIYLILSIATAWVGHDSLQVLMPQIVYPFRYASAENRWDELFLPLLPRWLYVSDRTALFNAYAGGHRFWTPENFAPWLAPLLGWGSFCVALSALMVGLCLLLRHRWMDEERLTYPVLYLPREVAQPLSRFRRSGAFWLGLGTSAFVDILNGFAALYPFVPSIKVRVWSYDQLLASLFVGYPWQALQGTRMSFYPFAIGLGLLLPPDLLLSCWVFYWFERLQRLIGLMAGWTQLPGYPWTNFQAFGGYAGIGLFALWVARKSLGQTLRRAVRGTDTEERLGLGLLLVGLLFVAAFAQAMGMSGAITCLFFAIYLLLLIAITRIRAELGPPAHDLHNAGPDEVLIAVFGPQGLAKRDLVVAKLFYWFNRAYRSLPCPHYLEGLKVAKDEGLAFGRMAGVMLVTSVVSIAAAMLVHLYCFYAYGITAKFVGPAITAFGGEPFWRLQNLLAAPPSPNPYPARAIAAGTLFTFALMALRASVSWFPLHPVGYAISTSWSMNVLWMPLFIAYLVKMGLLRLGGYRAFRESGLPFGIGLVLGEWIIGNGWLIYGIVRGIQTYAFWV
ncbi:hypothetical protein HRbin17_01850 [bacterium HR17]|uniref:Uncharacterized protein n=1 Tax=Candidatus Fervidibacter japonicus TaxID=2035412 RepID=A0A2H5XDR5_9BACT|nr:hypothetical protein HRbin17_01850 [bacterium HR17]